MADWTELTADDGHKLAAWHTCPDGTPRGGLVVLQEIFGVNAHMREVIEGFAADGYAAICPALYDRVERNVELGYSPDEVAVGRDYRARIPVEDTLRDMKVAIAAVADAGRTGAIGYCWGGTLAWLAATRLGVDAAVGYYGSATIDYVDETPGCPTVLMLGETDTTFPPENIEKIRTRHPAITVFTYPAGHGFNCGPRGSYHEPSARHARERTLEYLRRHLG